MTSPVSALRFSALRLYGGPSGQPKVMLESRDPDSSGDVIFENFPETHTIVVETHNPDIRALESKYGKTALAPAKLRGDDAKTVARLVENNIKDWLQTYGVYRPTQDPVRDLLGAKGTPQSLVDGFKAAAKEPLLA